jgi:hypothetical protein
MALLYPAKEAPVALVYVRKGGPAIINRKMRTIIIIRDVE